MALPAHAAIRDQFDAIVVLLREATVPVGGESEIHTCLSPLAPLQPRSLPFTDAEVLRAAS